MIIDCHAHWASPTGLPPRFFEEWAGTLASLLPDDASSSRVRELYGGLLDDPEGMRLSAELDEAGIDRAALLVIDFGLAYPGMPQDLERIHLAHVRLKQRDPRFILFSGVDPRRGREGLDLFRQAVERWGFEGLKVYPPCGFSPSDPRLYPFYELCRAYGLPVLVHVGPSAAGLTFRWQAPLQVDEAARRFPEVPFILGHGGSVLVEEGALLARHRPNVYLDLSGFQTLDPAEFGASVARLCRQGLGRKICFGTDWPIHRLFGSQRAAVAKVQGLRAHGLSGDEVTNILSGNYLSLLKGERRHAGPDTL
jgi:predicted TIM-barrel fold metal-dependent hydrolase